MPGVLIDDLPFSLDSVSSASSPFFESLCGQQASSPSGFYSQAQLGPLLSPLSSSNCLSVSEKSAFQQQQQQLKFVNMSLDRPPQSEHCQYLDEQHLDAAAALWMNASSSNRFFNGNSNSTSNNSSSSINGDVVKDLLMEAMAASGSSSCESPRASPTAHEALAAALHKFLPSNNSEEAAWSAEDLYSCDEFRMFEFKVRRCMRGRSHDWTECPFAHPGEKARRRDPRRCHYSGTACPDFRKGNCKNGDACELAHGVFECWLHPARYRTQPCKDGRNCKRRVCFFAHTPEQLRLLPAAAQAAAAVSSSSSGSSCSSPKSSSSLRSGGGGSGSPLFRSFSDNNNSMSNNMGAGDRIGEGGGSSGCCCHHHHQQQYVGSPRHLSCSGHSCCRMLSSPTSTLVGLAHSPPPLSPPLSPSVSPPLSPSSASFSMSMAASAVARGALFSQQQQQQQSSSPSSAQRRHLERLASFEHQHQQQQQQQRRPLMHSYPSAPSSPGSSHHHHSPFSSSSSSSSHHGGSPMSDLVSALQQLELKGGAAGGGPMWMQQLAMANQSSSSSSTNQQQQYTTGPSPLRPSNTSIMGGNVRGCSSMSLPGTPTKPRWDCGGMWEMDVGEDEEDEMAAMASPRVESGRDLRAKIYGRLVDKKEAAAASRLEPAGGNGFEMEAAVAGEASPDLNWVNELVTE